MRVKFRTKLLVAFLLSVGIVATVGTWTGFSFLSTTVIQEAMRRVELDLGSAWDAFEEEKNRLQIVVGMASQSESIRAALRSGTGLLHSRDELEELRLRYQLDYLNLVDANGALPGSPGPARTSDGGGWNDPILKRALSGAPGGGTILIPRAVLQLDGEDLPKRASVLVVETEKATPTLRRIETRGMAIEAAFPVVDRGGRVLGAVYGGLLMNRRFDLVDRIRNAVFGDQTYKGRPLGTVTFFLDDVRIATNVMLDAGTRALGTRVSEQVRRQVLDRGERFADRAFVVNDWYLSAYDPIRDPEGHIIGIIYVGLLEKKYLDYRSSFVVQYLGISLAGLLLSALVALYLSAGIRRPILRLVNATRELSSGNFQARVRLGWASEEVAELGRTFNSMAIALEARTRDLERATRELRDAYSEVRERNRAYLETLGFVTHELKSPLASIVLGVGALREGMLGPLTAAQESVLRSAARSADDLQDTISNYLSLNRIEEGALSLSLRPVVFARDICAPIEDRFRTLADERGMNLSWQIQKDLAGACDPTLISSVFQNLLSNAVKYGRPGGSIRVQGGPSDRGGFLRFSVWNEGEGFDRDSAERLFQKFTRLGTGGETKAGTGLGLFVSRQIVERHGGTIWAESEPEQWARFSFEIPIDALQTEKPSSAANGSAQL